MNDEPDPDMIKNKHYKVKLLNNQMRFSLTQAAVFTVIFGLVGGIIILRSLAAPPSKSPTPTYTPMAVQYERFQDAPSPTPSNQGGCVGVDDFLDWSAAGSLNPGESYTFTPTHPTCTGAEVPVIISHLNWDASQLQLSTVVPDKDPMSNDSAQIGKQITSDGFGREANACMFVSGDTTSTYYYPFTVKNIGTQTAYNVKLTGAQHNGWISQSYNDCTRADADHDFWNDSLEHSIEYLTYRVTVNTAPPGTYPNYTTPYLGTNYLRVKGTDTANDETDFYPPDFNDDNKVDQADIDAISAFVGQGNNIGLAEITDHLKTDPTDTINNAFAWRRYDLDGDGLVTTKDVDMVKKLVGQPIPMASDILPPSVTIKGLSGTVAKGTAAQIMTYGFDNSWLTKVELYVNGKLTYTSLSPSIDNYWWQVPRKGGTFTVMAKAYDAAGNTATDSKTVVAQ